MPLLAAYGALAARNLGLLAVVLVKPANTAAPAVSGNTLIGSTLTCSTGTWTGTPTITYSYQWQRGGSNITGATSNSYVTAGADVGQAVTCTVTATNAVGNASQASSNSVTVALPNLGDSFGGGYYAGQLSTSGNGVATHLLIVAPKASGENSSKQWATGTGTTGKTSVIDGPGNSAALNSSSYPAAQFCEGLTIGGYSDWYLPAKNELEICYYTLKPTVDTNNTSSGTNTNAVPSRGSNYLSGTPGQTAITAFKSGGSEVFAADSYWSSTEYSSTYAWFQYFGNGYQYYTNYKTVSHYVRAVRRFVL